ncbi:hypothetical protein [Paenibacillus sacheonensis]|uniref:Uncharacterized protein n=1 Tax=Paenibacillus sacheonensis TaxID=742054 RepID=A0A7X4YLR0_9BACL|nr:hypothetical protein [Paenibacillus sacheonensis]MBM7566084.1 hypothetical protein [Paenibacillus sacheonensis]NBC68607.1 hypothetical protein [Paenibacillus sacheonensis]
MGVFKSFLAKSAIELFLLLFIYPAIGLALLVLGFTSSWKSGTIMLVSALLLRFVLKREAAAIRPMRRGKRWGRRPRGKRQRGQTGGNGLKDRFPGEFERGVSPPQLSDIYADMAAQLREQEALLAMLRQQERRAEWPEERRGEWWAERRGERPGNPGGSSGTERPAGQIWGSREQRPSGENWSFRGERPKDRPGS